MPRNEAEARYLAAFNTWNTLGPCDGGASHGDFNAQVALGLDEDRSPDAWVAEAERCADAGHEYNARVGHAETLVEVAASNFALGYSASDAWIGAAAYLAPRKEDDDALALDAFLDAEEARRSLREWRD